MGCDNAESRWALVEENARRALRGICAEILRKFFFLSSGGCNIYFISKSAKESFSTWFFASFIHRCDGCFSLAAYNRVVVF